MTGWKGGKADWTSAKMRTVSEIHNKPAVWGMFHSMYKIRGQREK